MLPGRWTGYLFIIRLQAVPETLQCIPTVNVQKDTAREVLLLVFVMVENFISKDAL